MKSNSNFPLVVLAGGYGTRMKFLNENTPKILSPINESKFIDLFFKNIKLLGFRDIYLLLHINSEQVIKYIKNNILYKDFNIEYLMDGENAMGTGGAIIKNLDFLPEIFWVMYGDTLLNWNVEKSEKKFLESNKSSLITVIHKDKVDETPNILLKDGKLLSYSKELASQNNYVDYGALIFKKNVFGKFQLNKTDLSEIITYLIKHEELTLFEATYKFYEIGNQGSYEALIDELKKRNLKELWNE